ncbi:MAG TPA: isoleucine--tRNA ligase [Flavobacteriales bacterium]|nr:isoleucine--tRNA ligase [Flavobacteriales bacterium]HIN40073.1 isoleucine--tRNA ligase [Flavobacteriales bacterium]
MSKYEEYKVLDLSQIGKDVLKDWKQRNIFEKSIANREGNPAFTFYEGPPSANGLPGIHHVTARSIKDIFCRYKTLKGFQVKRKAGWDTHGLPVELSVEKELGITKEDIGKKISIADYNAECRKSVLKYKDVWDDLTEKIGFWVDLSDPYITYDNKYIESLWSILKQLYEKDLLYKGYAVQPYSPVAGTGLSTHELNLPGCYKNIKDTSLTAQFKLKREERSRSFFDSDDEHVCFLAWTTTPWTLPANCALAVGNKISYVKIKTYNRYTFLPISIIMAKDLAHAFFSKEQEDVALDSYSAGDKIIPYEIVAEYKGADLVGLYYEQLMPYVQPEGDAFRVIPGDFVSTEDGTGIVHTASVFGSDDFRVCKEHNVPSIMVKDEEGNDMPLVDKQGRFVKEVSDFAGRYVKSQYEDQEIVDAPDYKSTDVLIVIKLKEENKAFLAEKYEHSYPHCWRTDKPILYYPLDSWFIKTTQIKDRLVELNKTINWKPESTGTGRFGNWLENLQDWNLSRSRFWGTPLPIWATEDEKERLCIGSLEEMRAEVAKSIEAGFMKAQIPDDFDLHRPYVDEVFLVSSEGQKMTREKDLIDVWFDSGAMPYAQWHYPMENKELFESSFPADFIAEGVDQTRGWFFTLHVIGAMLFDSITFKNVVSNGLVLDKEGNKMSKRLGNAADPFEIVEKYGPDATRWYMITNAQPWDNLKFDESGIAEVKRKFFNTCFNTYAFYALYANIDGYVGQEEYIPIKDRPEIDRWIISLLNTLVKEVDFYYDSYEPTKAGRAIQAFADINLSNWYVRLCRRRFWKGEYSSDKIAAYQTLDQCLQTLAKLSSPIAPFFMDKLYVDLSGEESVHLSDFPKLDESAIDKDLEERMTIAQNISSMVLSLRKREGIKVRQPLQKVMVPVLNEEFRRRLEMVENLILSEVNVKELEYLSADAGIFSKKIKPNFRKLGPRYGKQMKAIAQHIADSENKVIETIEQKKTYAFNIQGVDVEIQDEDVEISSENIPGFLVSNMGNLTVALDITITRELKEEGIARDLVNKIQNLRKDKNLRVTDKILLQIKSDKQLDEAINNNLNYICAETLASSLEIKDKIAENDGALVEINGEIQAIIALSKVQ